MRCPICKEQIDDDAQKCSHCSSYVRTRKRIWAGAKSILELATLIAAIIVLFLMWQANRIMQDSVGEAKRSVDLGREALSLTKASVEKIDSGFALTREQISIQQAQLDLQARSAEEMSIKFIEEKRPRVQIVGTKIDIIEDGLILYIDLDNHGFVDAEDVFTFILVKPLESPTETLYVNFLRVHSIMAGPRGQNVAYELAIPKGPDLTCHVGVGYAWKMKNLQYLDEKYFRFTYQKEPEKYRIHVLTQQDIVELWH
jgi:predicted nucleic acid-binding Zn ribbon protein